MFLSVNRLETPDAQWDWPIYLQNWVVLGVHVGKYTSPIEHLGTLKHLTTVPGPPQFFFGGPQPAGQTAGPRPALWRSQMRLKDLGVSNPKNRRFFHQNGW